MASRLRPRLTGRSHRLATERLTPGPRIARLESTSLHVAGLVLLAAAAGMLAAAALDQWGEAGEGHAGALAASGAGTAAVGAALWRLTRLPERVPIRSVFTAVATAWVVAAVAGAVPYLAAGIVDRPDDALFEAVSGFTTTAASLIEDLDSQSRGILLWRSLTQWLGGMGTVMLAVAVLPHLGTGGTSLVQAELPGPASDRLAPRVRDTARRLGLLYGGLTVVLAAAYLAAGMGGFDAANHAFTTVSTGGFSTHDANFAHFGSATLEWVAVAGMALAGTSFVLLWRALRRSPGPLLRSVEARGYFAIIVVAGALAVAWNAAGDGLGHDVVRRSLFTVVSVVSTTGFSTTDFGAWVHPAQVMLLSLMLVGGMTGSTAGGSKVFRLLAAVSFARREIQRNIHPRLVAVVRVGRDRVAEDVVSRIVGFHAVFLTMVMAGAVAIAAFDSEIVTALSAAAASLSNVGPGLGEVSPSGGYLQLDAGARGVTMFLMLLGRLEIYPVLLTLAGALGITRSALRPRRLRRMLTRPKRASRP